MAAPDTPPQLLDRAEAAFFATLAGDALGWQAESGGITTEDEDPRRASFSQWRFPGRNEEVLPGETSDDSQLTLALGRALISGAEGGTEDAFEIFTRTELPLWGLYQRGGGRATRAAAALLANGELPWLAADPKDTRAYFHAGGNGGAIRLSGLIAWHATDKRPHALMRDAQWFTAATHGHPRALIGATVQAYAGWLLVTGAVPPRRGALVDRLLADAGLWLSEPVPLGPMTSWLETAERSLGSGIFSSYWQDAGTEMQELLQVVARGLAAGDDTDAMIDVLGARGPMAGAGTVAVASVVHFASRFADNPVDGVLAAANARGTDADSVASMTGALLGFQHGGAWLPAEWTRVQDAEVALQIAADIVTRTAGHRPRAIMAADLGTIIGAILEGATELDLDGVRALGVGHPPLAVETPDGEFFRFRCITSEGQRVYIPIPLQSRP